VKIYTGFAVCAGGSASALRGLVRFAHPLEFVVVNSLTRAEFCSEFYGAQAEACAT
jgi:hypothetical protein